MVFAKWVVGDKKNKRKKLHKYPSLASHEKDIKKNPNNKKTPTTKNNKTYRRQKTLFHCKSSFSLIYLAFSAT